MGGLQSQPAHLLEIKLWRPKVDLPLCGDGQPLDLFARAANLTRSEVALELRWEEAGIIRLASDNSAVLITVLAAASSDAYARGAALLVTELALPYGGPGGLRELGVAPDSPAVVLRLAVSQGTRLGAPLVRQSVEELAAELQRSRERFDPDQPHIVLTVRELQGNLAPTGPSPTDMPEPAQAGRMAQLRTVEEENDKLNREVAEMRQRVEQLKAQQSTSTKAELPPGTQPVMRGHQKLEALKADLAQREERRHKIHANFEDRARGLQSQLQRAKLDIAKAQAKLKDSRAQAQASEESDNVRENGADANNRLDRLSATREELANQWTGIMAGLSKDEQTDSDTQAQELGLAEFCERATQCQDELRGLQRQAAQKQDKEIEQWTQNFQELRMVIQTLRGQLDSLDACPQAPEAGSGGGSESELAQAMSDVQRLRSKAAELRSASRGAPSTSDIQKLRDQSRRQRVELDELRRTEAQRKQLAQELQRERDSLLGWAGARVQGDSAPCSAAVEPPGVKSGGGSASLKVPAPSLQGGSATGTRALSLTAAAQLRRGPGASTQAPRGRSPASSPHGRSGETSATSPGWSPRHRSDEAAAAGAGALGSSIGARADVRSFGPTSSPLSRGLQSHIGARPVGTAARSVV